MKFKLNEEYECWADIPGRPNHQVSTHGRVRNKNTGRILNGQVNTSGYRVVSMDHNDHSLVHRLVCETFFGPPGDGQTQVNHVDCDRLNNHYMNLEWCTPSENLKWAYEHGSLDPFIGLERARQVNIKPVRIVETGQVFASLQDCADYLGVTRGNISRVLSGERKGQKIHGFHVEYVREEDM